MRWKGKEKTMVDRRTFLTLLMGAALTPATLAACGGSQKSDAGESEEPQATVANPFIDCASASEAAELAGFSVTFPEAVPGYSKRHYQAIEGEMAQCFYSEGDDRVLIRKAVDDGSGDISGDYNDYSVENDVTIGDVTVTERGDGNLVYVAIWTKDGYLFAIDADKGLNAEAVEDLVSATF